MNHLDLESSNPSLRLLHRWVWGELKNRDILPVWISDSDLDSEKKLELDFEAFPNFLNQADIKKLYALRKDIFEVWYKKLPESLHKNISPRMYFALMALQNGLEQRLDITSDEPYNATFLRDLKYEHGIPKLSDFCDGTSHATERAALGQWMLTAMGIPSVYMSGITFNSNIRDKSHHSWIVISPNTKNSMIFDIARPVKNKLPNLYKSETPISEEIFIGQNDVYIETRKLLGSSSCYFGVSQYWNMSTEIGYSVNSYLSTNIMPLL